MEEDVITHVEIVGSELQLLRDKASIDIQVSTAKAYPRDMQRCLTNAIFTATLDIETALSCSYAVPRAGKFITGGSVHFAKILMQNWGNFRTEARVTEVGSKSVSSESVSWDLETNVAVKVTVKRSITTNYGRMSEDMITVTGNAANSIAMRNSIFAVIPKAIVERVKAEVETKIVGTTEKFEARKLQVIEGFNKLYGKSQADVLALMARTKIEDITRKDAMVLIGLGQALKDGDTTIDQVFKKSTHQKKADIKANQQKAENPVNAMP